MSFDLINTFKRNLSGWKTRMQHSGVTSAYAVITASALWPIAAAAQSGDLSGLAALGTALGSSVGAKLIADQIRKWQDESDGARQIEALPKDDPIREHLDVLLQRLDAFTEAENALPDSERQEFRQMIQEELVRLGNFNRFEVQISRLFAKNIQINTGSIQNQTNNFY